MKQRRKAANPSATQQATEITTVDETRHTARFMASPNTIDRDNEMVIPSAYVANLDIYRKNPIVLWQHPWQYDELPPPSAVIGRCTEISVTPTGLEVEIQFAVNENQDARVIWDLVRGGFLKSVSVGFFSRQSVTRTSPAPKIDGLPPYARDAVMNGTCLRVHTEVELFEISVVPCGSNREAVALALKSGTLKSSRITRALAQPTDERIVRAVRTGIEEGLENMVKAHRRQAKLENTINAILRNTIR